jgi:hypothetical protein
MERLSGAPIQRGGALVTALAFTVVIALIIGGVSRLAVGHYSRTATEAEYSKALLLADAGMNHELRYISENQLTNTPAHQAGAPYTGSISGVDGTFTVWVTNDPDDGNDWSPPKSMILHSIGTVNGISRRIQARGTRQSIFDGFASFGYVEVSISGTNTIVNGDIGTNGTLTLNGGTTGVTSGHNMYLAGPDAEGVSGSNVILAPDPVKLPSIDPEIISRAPIVGWGTTNWDSIKAARQNASMLKLQTAGASFGPGVATLGSGIAENQNAALRHNTFNSITDGVISYVLDGTARKLVGPGTSGASTETGRLLILPALSSTTPTDYYFDDIDINADDIILIDNGGWTSGTSGTVRIWMGRPGDVDKDNIRGNVYFTDADPVKFRLYYSKCAELTLAGNSVWYGGIYAVQKSCAGTPVVKITGGSKIHGSVMANYIIMSGGSQIVFPANGLIDNPADFSLWFGFKNEWKEVPATGGTTFYDGTNR